MLMLVETYIDILQDYLCNSQPCVCSLIGNWNFTTNGMLGTGNITFLDDTNVIMNFDEEGTYQGTYELNLASKLLTIIIPEAFILSLKPLDSESFFSANCGAFLGYQQDFYGAELLMNLTATFEPSCAYQATSLELGNNVVVNGDFSDALNAWTTVPDGAWENIGDQAEYTSTDEGGYLLQDCLEVGKTYLISLDYVKQAGECGPSSNTLTIYAGTSSYSVTADSQGQLNLQLTCTNTPTLAIYGVDLCSPDGNITVDNIVIREVIKTEDISQGVLTADGACVTNAEIIDIINHLNSICSIFKCC